MHIKSFVNVAWVFTFIGFFAALIFSYAMLSERVAILANANGIGDEFVAKETFFYVALGLFAVFNMLSFIFLRVLTGMPVSSSLYAQNKLFKERFTAWVGSFISAINVCLICAVAYILLFNTQEYGRIASFNYLMYIGPAFLLISLVWLFMVLNRRKQLA